MSSETQDLNVALEKAKLEDAPSTSSVPASTPAPEQEPNPWQDAPSSSPVALEHHDRDLSQLDPHTTQGFAASPGPEGTQGPTLPVKEDVLGEFDPFASSEEKEAQPDSPDVVSPQSSKKRKRNEDPVEELEIDISLPEPLSRKEKRKAKKPKSEDVTDAKDGEPTKSADGAVKDKSSKGVSKDKEESKRSKWGIWIGNLPGSASKQDLKDFLIAGAGITEESITRIHMPAPTHTKKVPGIPVVNQNKGFAYVDFDTEQNLNNVLLLTETQFSQNTRKVLIKNATSFAGRPEKTVDWPSTKCARELGTGRHHRAGSDRLRCAHWRPSAHKRP